MDNKSPVHLAFVAEFRIRISDHAGKPEQFFKSSNGTQFAQSYTAFCF